MLEVQGVAAEEPGQGCEDMIARAAVRCLACSDPDQCLAWLASRHPSRTYPTVCPNGSIIEACRIMLDDGGPGTTDRPQVPTERCEPTVAEVLADPIVQELAEADRVQPTSKLPSQ
jgi:hypothetical protein